MRTLKSISMRQWNKRRGLISARIANTFGSTVTSSKGKRVALWSAGVLAFLVAPLAALVWSGGTASTNGLNLNGGSASTAADAQTQNLANGNAASGVSSDSASNSNDTDVNNNSSASVTVDGQTITAPDKGSVRTTVTNSDGLVTHVDITNSTTSTGDKKRTSSNLSISTHTSSDTRTKSSSP